MKNGRPLRPPAEALPAAGGAGGQDQPHRSGLAQRQDAARLGAGLQRPGGHTEDQIVIAAEVNVSSADFGQLEPMVAAARDELARAGVEQPPEVVLADAGYWHQVQMERLAGEGVTVLVPPDANKRAGARPGWDGGLYAFMRRVLATDARRRALRQAPGDDRAGLRRHQVQPPHRPLLTPRPRRRTLGMAAHQRRPQPAQALATHHSAGGGLTAAGARYSRRAADAYPTTTLPRKRPVATFRNSLHATRARGGHLPRPRRAPLFVRASERRRLQASDARPGRRLSHKRRGNPVRRCVMGRLSPWTAPNRGFCGTPPPYQRLDGPLLPPILCIARQELPRTPRRRASAWGASTGRCSLCTERTRHGRINEEMQQREEDAPPRGSRAADPGVPWIPKRSPRPQEREHGEHAPVVLGHTCSPSSREVFAGIALEDLATAHNVLRQIIDRVASSARDD